MNWQPISKAPIGQNIICTQRREDRNAVYEVVVSEAGKFKSVDTEQIYDIQPSHWLPWFEGWSVDALPPLRP